MEKIKRILIVGCGHSGTSLLIRILGSHSNIYAISNETGIFLSDNINEIDNRIKKFDRVALSVNKKSWIEKTPKHVYEIKKICSIIPEVKIIIIIRDPRDVACSLKARGFTFNQGLQRWIDDNSVLTKEMYRENIYLLKLEELVAGFDKKIKDVLNFLDLPYEDLSNYHKRKENWYSGEIVKKKPASAEGYNHKFFRNWQINQAIFESTRRFNHEMNERDRIIFNKKSEEIKDILKKMNISYGDL